MLVLANLLQLLKVKDIAVIYLLINLLKVKYHSKEFIEGGLE